MSLPTDELQRWACPQCGSKKIVEDKRSGEIYCSECGFVLVQKLLDETKEWREFGDEESEKRDRVGSPLSTAIYDYGLSTTLETGIKDATGKVLSEKAMAEAQKLRLWQQRNRAYNSAERNLQVASKVISQIADQLKAPKATYVRAVQIYRDALERGLVRGRPINSLAAAALYAACRDSGIPRTLKEVANASGLKRKEVARSYRLLIRSLESKMPLSDPAIYVEKVASKLKVGPEVERETLKILKEAKEKKITAGKDPLGMVAAAMYLATQRLGLQLFTQKQIAEASNVTEVTVRNRYKGLREALEGVKEA
ncbi:MAG: TFIIB-type zinc ribbon-containing protein [Thermoproteota archaeon]